MTFQKIVWKMAKYHYKKYLFYFLCNSAAVLFIFVFMTLYLNEYIVSVKQIEGLVYVLSIPGAALIMFTIFFISYAHQIFMKKRRSEFGLFMTLGMTNRDIAKLLLLENSVIGLVALIVGLGSGVIISRLIFWLLLKSVDITDFAFQLNVNMFTYTVGAFFIVFIISIGQSLYMTMSRNIIDNVKTEKITENTAHKHPAIGGIGVAIVVGSIVGLYVTYTDSDGGEYLLLWALGTFLGLYIALNQLTSFLIGLIKKNKHFYYRKLLYLTSLDYKYKQFTTIMTIVTIMIMVTLLYSTIVYHLYKETEKEVVEQNPYDIGYISTDSKNNLSAEELDRIFAEYGNPIREHLTFPIYFHFQEDYDGYTYQLALMPLSVFNEFSDNPYLVQPNELIYHLNHEVTGEIESLYYRNDLRFSSNGEEVIYETTQVIAEKHFNYLGDLFILHDADLADYKENINGMDATLHLIHVENWQESEAAVLALEHAFHDYNAKTPLLDVDHVPLEEELFYIDSRVDGYESTMNANGISFFVTIFFSILFFIGSFLLLYIQLFSEVDKEEQRIQKLYRIGITSKEVRKLISQEITTLFMLPTLLGLIIALLYIIAMAQDIGGIVENPLMLVRFFMLAGIYFVILTVFMNFARKKMFKDLVDFK